MDEKSHLRHKPVMLEQVVAHLPKLEGALVVDATFGAGGYTRRFLELGARVIACDRDGKAIADGHLLQAQYPDRLTLVETKFSHIERVVQHPIDALVLDIGVSSMQIDEAERGFSFQKQGPLDMRMSGQGLSAADIVNDFAVEKLTDIFFTLGEERHSRRIARAIEKRRGEKAFTTTLELSHLIEMVVGRKFGAIHPATRVFQALRIYVNDELGELARVLLAAERLLRPGGHLCVVTFHSLEDRIVKQFLRERCGESAPSRYVPEVKERATPSFKLLFKGAKKAEEEEIADNPRARSAKLRVGVRTSAPPYLVDKSYSSALLKGDARS